MRIIAMRCIFWVFLNLLILSEPINAQVMMMPTGDFNRPCVGILPGINRMRNGVDLTMLDLFPIDSNIQDGFRRPVVDFTCNERKMETFDRVLFDIPDQIWNFVPLPAGLLDAQVHLYQDKTDILNQFARDVNLEITKTKGVFTGSSTFNFFKNYLADNEHTVEDVSGTVVVSKATLLPHWALRPSVHLQHYADNFLTDTITNEKEAQKYEEFIQIFGTHFFTSAKFGGMIRMNIFSRSSLLKQDSKETIEGVAKVIFKQNINQPDSGTLNLDAIFKDGEHKALFQALNKASDKKVRYYGGHSAIGTTGATLVDIAVWEGTVHRIPWLLGGNLLPVYELLDNPSKRENLRLMTRAHMDKAELNMLQTLLSEKLRTHGSHSEIRAVLRRIEHLLSQYMPDHREVEQISKTVDVPAWFLKNTLLCHRWRIPESGRHNCPDGIPNTRCAKPGEMTQFYIDRSSNGYGCDVSWGLRSDGYDDWMENVTVCFAWQGADADECGGAEEGEMCSKLNSFTPYYHDTTHSDGCGLQWKLVIPDSAPLWTHGIQLCVQWSAFDSLSNNYYCGGYGESSLGTELCAGINNWTNVYFDKTMESGGYLRFCKLSWGIKIL